MLAFLTVLTILSLICIFILLERTGSTVKSLTNLHHRFIALNEELAKIKQELYSSKSTTPQQTPEKPVTPIVIEEAKPEPVIIKPLTPEPIPTSILEVPKETPPTPVAPREPIVKEVNKAPRPKTFFEKNPDLEKFIGENLINKIGIAVLVIGVGFFVKFAIDQDWINEIGRVFIGILCGGILLGVAHYTRNSFRAFSSVLAGGGIAIFYLTIAIAFHEYKLFSQTIAFVIMVVITLFAVLLSIIYDKKELAVLAIIGGFTSPFLVSTGSGNYQVLFTYILILNIGMIVLSYFKRWSIINILCFAFTALLFGGWLFKAFSYTEEAKPIYGAMLFATIFYVVFFLMNILNNLRETKKFVAIELTLLIANTFLYYSAGMFILKYIQDGLYQGLFTALVAVFNFIFAFVLFKSKKADATLVYLLIGLVLTFVTLSAPIQLKGNYITLFWSAEAVLLLWLSQKSGIKLMQLGSIVITFLMLISLVMDWNNVYMYNDQKLNVIFNKGFLTGLVAIVSLLGTILLLKKEEEKLYFNIPKNIYSNALTIALLIVGYIVGLLEVNYQTMRFTVPDQGITWDIPAIYTGCYNFAFVLIVLSIIRFRKLQSLENLAIGLGIIASLSYVLYYSGIVSSLRDNWLVWAKYLAPHYWFHYVISALLLFILANVQHFFNKNYSKTSKPYTYFLWFSSFIIVFLASSELENAVLTFGYTEGKDLYLLKELNTKVGLPILWGICSLTFMVVGMKKKIKMLRIISLTLFGIALVKMFVFDIQEMSEGGKIAAFISLGVLLLIVSFLYQKLKKIVTEE